MGEETTIENIEEVVLAVRNADESVKLFEDLFGMKFDLEWEMPAENMRVKSARIGKTQFQIVGSTSPDGVIAKFVQKRGEGLHHICFKVKNLGKVVERLKGKGAKIVPEEPIDFGLAKYVFVHPRSTHGVLIELIEMKSK